MLVDLGGEFHICLLLYLMLWFALRKSEIIYLSDSPGDS